MENRCPLVSQRAVRERMILVSERPGVRRWIGILQPCFLPWIGYFEQMDRVDHFVFQDDAQYTTRDWRNRNRILARGGPIWLTVPVRKASLATPICDIEISYEADWQTKHLRSLTMHYARAPGFAAIYKLLEAAYGRRPAYLADLTIELTMGLAGHLGICVETSRSSRTPRTESGDLNARLIRLATAQGATSVYFGASSEHYIDCARFAAAGIKVVFQEYDHPHYAQPRAEFQSHMSAIDLLMAHPDRARDIMLSGRSSVLGST